MKHVTPFGLPFSNFVLLSKKMKHYDSNERIYLELTLKKLKDFLYLSNVLFLGSL